MAAPTKSRCHFLIWMDEPIFDYCANINVNYLGKTVQKYFMAHSMTYKSGLFHWFWMRSPPSSSAFGKIFVISCGINYLSMISLFVNLPTVFREDRRFGSNLSVCLWNFTMNLTQFDQILFQKSQLSAHGNRLPLLNWFWSNATSEWPIRLIYRNEEEFVAIQLESIKQFLCHIR